MICCRPPWLLKELGEGQCVQSLPVPLWKWLGGHSCTVSPLAATSYPAGALHRLGHDVCVAAAKTRALAMHVTRLMRTTLSYKQLQRMMCNLSNVFIARKYTHAGNWISTNQVSGILQRNRNEMHVLPAALVLHCRPPRESPSLLVVHWHHCPRNRLWARCQEMPSSCRG